MTNHYRTAYRIIRELSYVMNAVPRDALPHVARGLAQTYQLPAKPFLQVIRRYVRLYRPTN
jgi:hypothetical protein